MKQIIPVFLLFVFCNISLLSFAQDDIDVISSATTKKDISPSITPPKLQLGGYGEVSMQRMFYSDNVARYKKPEAYKDADGFGRFDLPHVVFFVSYNFGKGWKISTEIEYEHGGAGSAVEIENEETGEYELEAEKGGEVALEQFWIEKTFSNALNLRIGHIIVPVGLINMHHLPTEFFSVLRPEEESGILPCTWHETGISLWGRTKNWYYEGQFLAGLDAERFSNSGWIKDGSVSPYEFTIANKYAGAFRVDNYSVKGLRIGFSGYFGFSAENSLKSENYKRYNANGSVTIGSIDGVYNANNVLARANFVYGYLGDSKIISKVNKKLPSASPSPRTDVASDVMSYYVEAGYNVLSFFKSRKNTDDRLYIYGHYGYYNSMYKTAKGINPKGWCEKNIISAGLNYFPKKEIVIKGEYTYRNLKSPWNDEPTVSIGIGYSGFFLK